MAGTYWERAHKAYKNSDKKEDTGKARELMAWIFSTFVDKVREDYNEFCRGKNSSDLDKIEKLEKQLEEILETIDDLKKYPKIMEAKGANFIVDTKAGINEGKELISVKKELAEIWGQNNKSLDKENFTWQKVKETWEKIKKRASVNRPEWLAKAAEMSKEDIFGQISEWACETARAAKEEEDLPSNSFPSTHEELNFLQEIADEFPRVVDKILKERYNGEVKNPEEFSKYKEANEELKLFIQEQRKKLGSNRPTKKPNPQNLQKEKSLQNEINSLNKKITELQAQIKELKKNQNSSGPQSTKSPEIQQKIENLQSEKAKIQTQLEQKQSQQKELKDKVNSQINRGPSPDNKFNWLYVVIPGGILLVVAGIVIAYLVGKRNKEKK